MKVVVEIETHDDLLRTEQFLKSLDPALITLSKTTSKTKKRRDLRQFFHFIDTEATPVSRIIIPNREERNARYSEDMSDGQQIENVLTIRNPFKTP